MIFQSDYDNKKDIDKIIEYQHKILRKYTMKGKIQYSDAPFFHDMVDQRDYKIISIFEVFAINRNEEDFLENLGLFTNMIATQEDQEEDKEDGNSEDSEGLSLLEAEFPLLKVVNQFKSQLTPEEYEWCVQAVKNNGKIIKSSIEAFTVTNDDKDLIHTMKKIYNMKKE